MNFASRILAGSMVASLAVLAPRPTVTAASSEARVTQIIRDVKLLPSEADARPAAVDDKVSEDTAVRTGGESRSELTFSDLTITRLGADTIFSFSKAGRTAKLDSGSILLRVPKDSRGGAINTNVVTVAITGTTVIFESDAAGNIKLITLEGRARLSLVKDPRRVRNVRAGQMLDVPPDAAMLPVPVEVDLDELLKTHPLITDFAPLPSQDLIAAVALQQRKSSPGGRSGTQPRPSPSPLATRPQRSPSPTPRIVTPTPSPKPSVTPTPTPTSTPELTPTPRPTPSVPPTPNSPRPTPSSPPRSPTASPTPAPSPTWGRYDYWTPTPPPRPSPTASPTPAPSPTRGDYHNGPTHGGRISPVPSWQRTPQPIVTPTPKTIATPTPKPIGTLPPRPAPSPFPIRRATPTPTPAQIRKLVLPTPKPRASPTPFKRPPASPIPKQVKPTPTPVIR